MNWKSLLIIAGALVAFAVIMRIVPHAPNMTPVAAIAFASSLYLGRRWAIILPLAALLLSDMIIGFYGWQVMLSVYGSFGLIGVISWIGRRYRSVLPVGLSVISGSILFFLITNGAVWMFSPWYEKSLTGLLYSYEMGLPFLRNMLIGDVVYTAGLVAAFECAYAVGRLKIPLPRLARAAGE